MADNKCGKCNGAMAVGFIPDFAPYNYALIPSWHEDQPRKSIWWGHKTKGVRSYPLVAYRCAACGFIELYAR